MYQVEETCQMCRNTVRNECHTIVVLLINHELLCIAVYAAALWPYVTCLLGSSLSVIQLMTAVE